MIRIILDQLYSALWLNENYLCMHRKKHRTSIKRPFLAVSQTKNKKKKKKKRPLLAKIGETLLFQETHQKYKALLWQ